jgi:hypothetical protein
MPRLSARTYSGPTLLEFANLLSSLQPLIGRVKNIPGVVLPLEALEYAYPDATVPAQLSPIVQTF